MPSLNNRNRGSSEVDGMTKGYGEEDQDGPRGWKKLSGLAKHSSQTKLLARGSLRSLSCLHPMEQGPVEEALYWVKGGMPTRIG